MSDYYLDTKNVREQFTVKADWDTYLFEPGICHEKDIFFEDAPKEVQFFVFKNGDVGIQFEVVSLAGTYVVKSDGKLLQSRGITPRLNPFATRIEFKPAFTLTPSTYEPLDLGPTESFYRCYLGSSNLNQHLTDHQKAIVERFFCRRSTNLPERVC